LKNRFTDFIKVAFCDTQKADIEFSGAFDYLKHYFLDLVQVAFFDAQEAENEFSWPIDTLKHRFIEYTQSHFGPIIRQKMKSRIRQSIILCWPERRDFVLRACQPLEISFPEIIQVAFWDGQKAEMRFQGHSTPRNIAFSNSAKSLFTTTRKPKIISHRQTTP
jgi:hypothetical protein